MSRIVVTLLALTLLQSAPADLAAQLSGRWTLNPSLSDQGRGGRRGGGAAFSVMPAAFQRGGRGGATTGVGEPAADIPRPTDAEAAAQQALAIVQEFPSDMTIEATAKDVTFRDPRGDSTFEVDGKSKTIAVPGGSIKVKSRWDRTGLRQEFSSSMRVVRRAWSLDAGGQQLVLKQELEGIGLKLRETRATYDRR